MLTALAESQRRNLPLWIPVFLGLGIGVYFALPREPEPWMFATLGALVAMGAGSLLRAGPMARVVILAALLPLLGLCLAGWRTHEVGAPVLSRAMTVNVEGRVVGLDRSASDRPRVTLDHVIIYGLDPLRTPARVRISLDPATPADVLQPGLRILGQARLSPPSAPAEPGGFDFRRYAWFEALGAIGYSNTPFLERRAEGGGWRQGLFATRIALSRAIQAALPGPTGGFAAALLTGDRSAVSPEDVTALRRSNLAHLLAISGLHMGLLAGFVFAAIRRGLALVPRIALWYNTKKIAAVVALGAAAAYLALSGASVATQRAFIMTAVVLVAVLLDRPALTLRSVALAATIILVREPESLTEAGFQMSFAATTALIAAFEWLRGRAWWRETQTDPRWRFVRPVIGVAATSFVAGLATAPISAFHFNTLSQYGLLANILAVPAMGLVVMPAGVLAGLLAPIGLAPLALRIMGLGIDYILAVATFVAGLGGAVRAIPAGPPAALALIAFGGIFAVLWVGRGRSLALLPLALGFGLWAAADRPDVLVAENGRLFGVQSPAGRVVNSASGNSFAASIWLGNDGDAAPQAEAYARSGMERRRGFAAMDLPGGPDGGRIIYLGSSKPPVDAAETCEGAAILIAPGWRESPGGRCLFIGAERLRREGALAIRREDGRLRVTGARTSSPDRPWTRPDF
ncbi:ComEC/Rec2 family competence protein [Rhodobacteraceae bacterium DSL-40]|uniref:ComEC/Rec2 family competence protein n=1 Tax=Amaricoccus sp. B4 TaxID=3368557 RepID=UPI000DAD3AC2